MTGKAAGKAVGKAVVKSALAKAESDSDEKPQLSIAQLPKSTLQKVGNLPKAAQLKFKEVVKAYRVWFGEVKNPWTINDVAIDWVLPVLWKHIIGASCDWDLVHPTHRKVATRVVSCLSDVHSACVLILHADHAEAVQMEEDGHCSC
jgi:hypothetical protein